jgi:hypothetical protein
MPIPVICSCSAKMKVGDHLLGKHVKCPKCGTVLPVGETPAKKTAPAKPKLPSRDEILDDSTLSNKERDRLEDELEKNEQLLWAGKPVERVAFVRAWAISAGLFSVAVTFLAIGLVMIITQGLKGLEAIIWIGLLVGAAGLTVAGFVYPSLKRNQLSKFVYAITNRRAMSWSASLWGRKGFADYAPEDMAKLHRIDIVKEPEPVGHLVFGYKRISKDNIGGYGFMLIRRPATVEKLLREHLVEPYLERLYE